MITVGATEEIINMAKEKHISAQLVMQNFMIRKIAGTNMEPMDLIRDKFSQDCTIETVLHLLMAHFDLSEEEAQAEIDDEYFLQFEVHVVGGEYHQELWVLAEELDDFNQHIIGKIQVIKEFSAEESN